MPDRRITYPLLRALVPHYRHRPGNTRGVEQEQILHLLAAYLEPTLDRWGIDTVLRKAHFLGQTSVESRDFTSTYEDKDDHTPVDGSRYELKSNLGNDHPGDGARYIGRGLLQLTGRYNYNTVGNALDKWRREHHEPKTDPGPHMLGALEDLDLVNHPERVALFPTAIDVACEYWMMHHINHFADKDDAIGVTAKINAALAELPQRIQRTNHAKKLLSAASDTELNDALHQETGIPTFSH